LRWKKNVESGNLIAPHIYTSGPILEQAPLSRPTNTIITSKAKLDSIVSMHKAAGFDFIKIYDNISKEYYEALLTAAAKYSIPVIGHIPTPVGLDMVLEKNEQASIEHFEELLPFFADGRDSIKVAEYARRLAESKLWLTATADVYQSAVSQTTYSWNYFEQLPGYELVSEKTKSDWRWLNTYNSRFDNKRDIERYQRTFRFFINTLLPAFKKSHVKLLIGTDAPIPVLVPGYALLDEMNIFYRGGFTNAEVLKIATHEAASFLHSGAGSIEAGKMADLVLLSVNPLLDLNAFRSIQGVMVKGKWYSITELQSVVEKRKPR
jgi:hypothetical protein